jgi:hypothetical protein
MVTSGILTSETEVKARYTIATFSEQKTSTYRMCPQTNLKSAQPLIVAVTTCVLRNKLCVRENMSEHRQHRQRHDS